MVLKPSMRGIGYPINIGNQFDFVGLRLITRKNIH